MGVNALWLSEIAEYPTRFLAAKYPDHPNLGDMTNKILVENSKLLHSNSVNVAKESERSVVSISTLKSTTDELIKTIKEVNEIHKNGIKERKQIESNLQQFALQI